LSGEPTGPVPGLAAVKDLARATHGATDAAELLRRICASVAVTFGFRRTAILRYLGSETRVELLATHGVPAVRQVPASGADWQLARRAIETRDLVVVEDVRAQRRLATAMEGDDDVGVSIVLPLLVEDRCIGFLTADNGAAPIELDEHAAELLRTIGALVASYLENAIAHEDLRRLDHLKSNFIALASHELRTPAAVIYGISTTLRLRGETLTEGQLRELRHALYDQSERMRRLVDQLLDLSRLEANAIRIRPERVLVRERVEEIVATLVPEHAASVELDVPPALEALTDVNAFDRIVSNLITNAFRYGEPPVKLSAQQRDRHFRLAIEDRGPGVSPEFVPHLFERFTRGDRANEHAHGAGLGLSIAQSFAHAQGGDLIYSPAEPHGARFELVLPRPEAVAD
jgi:signal transduction histidine kinase